MPPKINKRVYNKDLISAFEQLGFLGDNSQEIADILGSNSKIIKDSLKILKEKFKNNSKELDDSIKEFSQTTGIYGVLNKNIKHIINILSKTYREKGDLKIQ
jgi:hypothetical protein